MNCGQATSGAGRLVACYTISGAYWSCREPDGIFMKTFSALTLTATLALQGCTAIAWPVIWLLDSPGGPRTCSVHTSVYSRPAPGTTEQIDVEISGGWLIDPIRQTYKPRKYPNEVVWLPAHPIARHRMPDNTPCLASAPLEIKTIAADGSIRTAVIPLASLPQAPVFGMFHLGVLPEHVTFSFSENKGKTRTTLHAGKLWAYEPIKELARVSLLASQRPSPPSVAEKERSNAPQPRRP